MRRADPGHHLLHEARALQHAIAVAQIAELERKIYAEAGMDFNINSPSQLGHILFEKLQYPVLKKTKTTKSFSTSVEVLQELAGHGYADDQHETGWAWGIDAQVRASPNWKPIRPFLALGVLAWPLTQRARITGTDERFNLPKFEGMGVVGVAGELR